MFSDENWKWKLKFENWNENWNLKIEMKIEIWKLKWKLKFEKFENWNLKIEMKISKLEIKGQYIIKSKSGPGGTSYGFGLEMRAQITCANIKEKLSKTLR
jgi:hypothetical protein